MHPTPGSTDSRLVVTLLDVDGTLLRGTIVNRNQVLVKPAKYLGFCAYRRSYLIWSPVNSMVLGNRRYGEWNDRYIRSHAQR